MVQDIVFLGITFGAIIVSLYFMYRNHRTHSTLINISNELKYKITMANSKEDTKHISSIMKKLIKRNRYFTMLFSFKSFTQLDYELRKDIGML